MIDIHENETYIENVQLLIDAGFAKKTVHTVHIEANSPNGRKNIEELCEQLDHKFKIYQYKREEDGRYKYCYTEDWDLFFFMNKTNLPEFSYVQLSFNTRRSLTSRNSDFFALLEEIKSFPFNDDEAQVWIQYDAEYEENKLLEAAELVVSSLKNDTISFGGEEGTIRTVPEFEDSYYGLKTRYGFFKKRAKKRYTPLSTVYIVKNALLRGILPSKGVE